MSYSTIEAAVQTILQGLSQYSDSDVTRGDYRVLDQIQTDCAVLTPGSFGEPQRISQASYRAWDVLVDIFYIFRDDGSSWENFCTSRDNVVDELEKYPTLDGTSGITAVEVSATSDPLEVFDADGRGPFYLTQQLRVAVLERSDTTGGEFA